MGDSDYWDLPITLMRKRIVTFLLVAFVALSEASAQSVMSEQTKDWQGVLEDAQQALSEGRESDAVSLYRAAAGQGNPLAQFSLGWFFKMGMADQATDANLACIWFEKSTAHDIPVGLQETGHCYRHGVLESESPFETAIHYYNRSQQNGVFVAACDVLETEIVALNKEISNSLNTCEAAAQQGALYAQEVLIELYADPNKLNDNERALLYLEHAAPRSGKSAYRLALTLANAESVPKEEVIKWFETSANLGFLPAYMETAVQYYTSITPDLEQSTASAYLAKAYMWSSAWRKRQNNVVVEVEWLKRIEQETPEGWKSALDLKVDDHLAKHAPHAVQ